MHRHDQLTGDQLTGDQLTGDQLTGDRLTDDHLTDESVALIVKKQSKAAGLNPDLLAGHRLRSGGTTAGAREGHDERELARPTRQYDLSVLRGYIRRANAFEDAAHALTSRVRR